MTIEGLKLILEERGHTLDEWPLYCWRTDDILGPLSAETIHSIIDDIFGHVIELVPINPQTIPIAWIDYDPDNP